MIGFKLFLENSEQIFSYDFDGVLHRSIWPGTTHPMDFWDWESWEPNETVFVQLRRDAQAHKVVVVSKRDDPHQEPMWEFIRAYNLPVDQIYTTNNRPKRSTLIQIGAIRHYDDDGKMQRELAGTGIEFVLIDPTK